MWPKSGTGVSSWPPLEWLCSPAASPILWRIWVVEWKMWMYAGVVDILLLDMFSRLSLWVGTKKLRKHHDVPLPCHSFHAWKSLSFCFWASRKATSSLGSWWSQPCRAMLDQPTSMLWELGFGWPRCWWQWSVWRTQVCKCPVALADQPRFNLFYYLFWF